MNKFKAKRKQLERRKRRVRAKIFGTAERPRLNVRRSNAHIYAQLVNDVEGRTICSASTLDASFRATGKVGSNKEAAEAVGKLVGSAPWRRASPRSPSTAVATSTMAV